MMEMARGNWSLRILLLILAMLFTISGCGRKETELEGGQGLQTVKIGLLSIDDSLPFYIAEQEGYFKEAGVDVELVTFGSALDKETALEAGELDGDMTDLVVTGLLMKGGLDIRVVETALGAVPEEGRFALLAAPDSGITSVEELKNQPVAIGNNTIIEYVNDQICYLNGFLPEEIKTQNMPDLVLRMETLLSGGVKAAVLPDPLASAAIANGAVLLADDTELYQDGQKVNLSQSVIIFRRDSLEAKETEVKKVMEAYDKAKQAVSHDPEKYRSALLKFTNISDKMIDSYRMPSYTAKALPTRREVENVFQWMYDKKLIDRQYSYDEIVDGRFAE